MKNKNRKPKLMQSKNHSLNPVKRHGTLLNQQLIDLLRDQNNVTIRLNNILLENGTVLMKDIGCLECIVEFNFTYLLKSDEELDQELTDHLFDKIDKAMGKRALRFALHVGEFTPSLPRINFFDFRDK